MKKFNTTGACVPEKHYMVNLQSRLAQIKAMVDAGQYFTINRARQFGKTTTLVALAQYLKNDYLVLRLDFQGIGNAGFQSEESFVQDFCRLIRKKKRSGLFIPDEINSILETYIDLNSKATQNALFDLLSEWCSVSSKKIVLLIDEVDSATNNQVFLDFLAQLRQGYIDRNSDGAPAFHSVILAGVTDIKNLRRKIRPDEDRKFNSPWNIAADFKVVMSFNTSEIEAMLHEYEADHHTGMDIMTVAQEIYNFSNGYPFLVSRICQLLDEEEIEWSIKGVAEIVRRILMEKNALFASIMGKVHDNLELSNVLQRVLFSGEKIAYNAHNIAISDAEMYGLILNDNGTARISNRIFETLLYEFYLISDEIKKSVIFQVGADEKETFVVNGRLQMEHLLQRFVTVFDDLYGDQDARFDEEEGRRRFLLFVRAVINGAGNYYVEAQTRNKERMDLVIDYGGERFVVELKIWRGNAYNERGEKQLAAYLDYFHMKKGYMLSYNFNKAKTQGIRHIQLGDKELIEAVV